MTAAPPILWMAARDTATLLADLDSVDLDWLPEPGAARGPVRLGIVAPTERKLRLARRMVAKGEPWRGRSDVWFTPAGLASGHGGAGKVAFLFPGVEPAFGAQDMDLPRLAEWLDLEAPPLSEETLAHRSASIVRLGIFLDTVVRQLGVDPDLIAGHSIGEWSGSVAAGMFPRNGAERLLDTIDLGGVELPDLDFAALSAGIDAVTAVVGGIEHLVISHDNCPGQSVVCGPPASVGQALDALRDAGILGYTLDFRSGFHTPFMAESLDVFRDYLEGLAITAPETPMWSATTAAPYPSAPLEIVELHLRHLVEPVRFRQLVEGLYHEAGARVFVQLGVGTLTSFVSDTLGDADHATIQLLTPKRSALDQMQRVLTALWVEGLDLSPLARPDLPSTPDVATAPAPGLDRIHEATELLLSASRAGIEVLDALTARMQPSHQPVEPAASQPARAWPIETVVVPRHLSLETMPETVDHSLYHQPEGWPDPTDAFPIVAMTTQIQLLQDVASELAGGRQVIEVFGVRNFRWLDLSSPQDVDITIVPKDGHVLSVALGSFCRANLRFGQYEPAPHHEPRSLVSSRPTRLTAQEMFDRWIMFHGPRFQGITQLGPTGDDGIVGDFHNLDTPGSLLDNLGKLVAYWVIDQRTFGESPLPIGVESIKFFGPMPPAGVALHCDVRVVELQDSQVKANGVIVHPDGTVWCRVEGWTSNVFHLDPVMEPIYHETEHSYAAEPQTGGWNVVVERWPTGAGRDLTSRRFLSRAERDVYDKLNLLEQRRWLIDVIAAKDTVRRWLGESSGIPTYPVEIALEPDGERRFRAVSSRIPDGRDVRVTVSSLNWLAVAILGDGEYRDIEAREIPDGGDPSRVADEAADQVGARMPGATVDYVSEVANITPSNIDAVVIPRFAVAWTA